MGEVPALRLRGVTYDVENEVVNLPAAHTLATPSADDTVDESAASNRIPADGLPSQDSTSDESLELGDDQDSMDKKDSSDNDPSFAVSSLDLCEWDYLMFSFTPQFFGLAKSLFYVILVKTYHLLSFFNQFYIPILGILHFFKKCPFFGI